MKAYREAYDGVCEEQTLQVNKVSDDITQLPTDAEYYRDDIDSGLRYYYVAWDAQMDAIEGLRVAYKYKINRKYYDERFTLVPLFSLEELMNQTNVDLGEEKENESDNQIESNSKLQQSASDSQAEAV